MSPDELVELRLQHRSRADLNRRVEHVTAVESEHPFQSDHALSRPEQAAYGSILTLAAMSAPPYVEPPLSSLDVVIPAYNEELRIGAALSALCREFAAEPARIRVLVVDNGSVDGTVEVVDRVQRHGVRVDIVNCRKPGKGAAVRAGVAHGNSPFFAYVDADTSVAPHVLGTGLALLEHGWDGVIGSRRALGGQYAVAQPLLRRVGSRAFNLAARTIVGRLSDTQCGMKMFRREMAADLFVDSRIDGFAFDVEILARARAKGINMMELPVTWTDTDGSSFAPVKDGIASFREIARVHRLTRTLPRAA